MFHDSLLLPAPPELVLRTPRTLIEAAHNADGGLFSAASAV